MKWISVHHHLPRDGQRVLVWLPKNNVFIGKRNRMVHVTCAVFVRGKVPKQGEVVSFGDFEFFGNNKVPYAWRGDGCSYFGQDVSHWAKIPQGPRR